MSIMATSGSNGSSLAAWIVPLAWLPTVVLVAAAAWQSGWGPVALIVYAALGAWSFTVASIVFAMDGFLNGFLPFAIGTGVAVHLLGIPALMAAARAREEAADAE